jgi:hypothetical protein
MNCADLEILLCDYLDGTLAPDGRAEVERHLARCASCGAMAKDISGAVEFIGRAAAVEPPPQLLTRILFELSSAHHARASQPGGLRKFLRGWLQPILQPRFAMSFALTMLSFSMLFRFAGVSPRQLTLDDLRPERVWQVLDDKVYRGWQRGVKFYENLRFVYEIQTQVREWRQQEQEIRGPAASRQPPPASGARQGASRNSQRTGVRDLGNEK